RATPFVRHQAAANASARKNAVKKRFQIPCAANSLSVCLRSTGFTTMVQLLSHLWGAGYMPGKQTREESPLREGTAGEKARPGENAEAGTRPGEGFELAAARGARSAAERKPRQELAVVRGACHNHDRIYPNRRGSFFFSARLGTRRLAMTEANGSRPFA